MNRRSGLAAGILAAVLLLPSLGCEISFPVNEPIGPRTIPGSASGGTIPQQTWSLSIQEQEAFSSRGYDNLKELWVRDLVLSIDSGPNATFDFLTALEVYLEATIDGVFRSEIVAFLPAGELQLSSGLRRIHASTTNFNVLPFIEAPGGYTLRVAFGGQRPLQDVVIRGRVQYYVTAEQ